MKIAVSRPRVRRRRSGSPRVGSAQCRGVGHHQVHLSLGGNGPPTRSRLPVGGRVDGPSGPVAAQQLRALGRCGRAPATHPRTAASMGGGTGKATHPRWSLAPSPSALTAPWRAAAPITTHPGRRNTAFQQTVHSPGWAFSALCGYTNSSGHSLPRPPGVAFRPVRDGEFRNQALSQRARNRRPAVPTLLVQRIGGPWGACHRGGTGPGPPCASRPCTRVAHGGRSFPRGPARRSRLGAVHPNHVGRLLPEAASFP